MNIFTLQKIDESQLKNAQHVPGNERKDEKQKIPGKQSV